MFSKFDIDELTKESTDSVTPMERRTFLKMGLLISGVFAGGKVLQVKPAEALGSHGGGHGYKPHYGMVIRQQLCIDCEKCVEACTITNDVPSYGYRTRILERVEERAIGQKREFIPVLCNQCNNPPCVRACPTSATYKDKENGIIHVDPRRCIGCKTCMLACPYNARYLKSSTKTVDKCNFCYDTRLSKGEKLTACAEACPAGVRVFGDVSDPSSKPYALIYQLQHPVWVLRPESGAEPNIFYTKG